jgi:ribokinase
MPHDPRPVVIIGDLIADLALHIEAFPVNAADLKKLGYVELGPGGACNTAIMVRRFGLPVACLGEVGEDRFGAAVLHGLAIEQIDASGVVVSPDGRTPVAGVLVDARAEPAYLGYPGALRLSVMPESWPARLRAARAVCADGWAEHAGGGGAHPGRFSGRQGCRCAGLLRSRPRQPGAGQRLAPCGRGAGGGSAG